MSSEKIRNFGTYNNLNVTASWREISDDSLNAPLKIPEENTDLIWLKLAKMLAQSYAVGIWGKAEEEALGWVREISSADSKFLKGDLAVWAFIIAEQRKSNLKGGKPGRTKLAKHEQKVITSKLEEGVTISQIAREHGVSRGTIQRFRDNHVGKPKAEKP